MKKTIFTVLAFVAVTVLYAAGSECLPRTQVVTTEEAKTGSAKTEAKKTKATKTEDAKTEAAKIVGAGEVDKPTSTDVTPTHLKDGIDTLAARHKFKRVKAAMYGGGADRYFIFEPESAGNAPLPLVLFVHGWGGMNPVNYGPWIEHLVLQGFIVVFPIYQVELSDPPQGVTKHATSAFKDALNRLGKDGHATADLDRVVAIGYSMGATISANMAAAARKLGLPRIRGLLLANPGDARHVAKGDLAKSIIGKLSTLPADTLVVTIVGDSDKLVKDRTAIDIGKAICGIPAANRRMYVLHSASHGTWAATAGHGAPGAPDPRYDFGDDGSGFKPSIPPAPWPTISKSVNNFDVFAYWPLADDLIDKVIRNRKASRKDSGKKLFMGKWPDGKPFPRASIAPDPCLPEIESN